MNNSTLYNIVNKRAKDFYYQRYRVLAGWCDVEDIKQSIYERIIKDGLWDSKEHGLIYVVAQRACIDYARSYIFSYSRKNKGYTCFIDPIDDKFDIGIDGKQEDCIDILSLHKLIDQLPYVQKLVAKSICEGETLKSIGDSMNLTESRICQIKSEIIGRLIHISKNEFKVIKTNPVDIKEINFKGFCKIHKGKKVFNKKRQLCFNCFHKLYRLGMLDKDESFYIQFLKRRLKHGEVKLLKRQYGN